MNEKVFWMIVAAAQVLGLLICERAFALELSLDTQRITPDISLGRCYFGHAADWIWNSPQFSRNEYLAPGCLEIGASWKTGEHEGLRLAVMKPADIEIHNFAPIGPDKQFFDSSKPCDTKAKTNCLADFSGRGSMLGVLFGAWYDATPWLKPEVGLMLYHTSFDVNASPASPGCDQALTWTRWDHASSTRTTPYLAAIVTYGHLGIRAEWFQKVVFQEGNNPGFVGATDNGSVKRLSISYQF